MIIGIDIGTSYSSVACLKNGRAEKIKPGTESDYSVPSAVYVKEDGTILIGRAAVMLRMKDPSRFKENFKRDFGAEVPYLLGGKSVTAYDIYLEYLRYFKESAEAFAGEAVEKAYITHPVSYSAEKKLLLKKAATYAGMTSVELLDEPTAAALSFFTEHNPKNGEKLLIYDLGGGTLDLTLAEVRDGGLRLLSDSVGDTRLGGADFDHLLYDELVAAFSKESDLSAILSNDRFIGALAHQAIEAKHNLSRDTSAFVTVLVGYEYLEYTLTRERFEELIAPLIERSCELARKIVENAGLAANQLDRVLLVGGSTRIPYVAKRLEEAMGKRVLTSGDPELAVCMGAVLREVVGVKATAEKTSAPARPAASVVQNPAPTSEPAQKWETNLDPIVDNAMKRLNSGESTPDQKARKMTERERRKDLKQQYLEQEAEREAREKAEREYAQRQRNAQAAEREKLVRETQKWLEKGESYYQAGNYAEAANWYRKAAEQGHAAAQCMLGLMYSNGQGVRQDHGEATNWYRKAAVQGNMGSQHLLALSYHLGEGVPQNYTEAANWYRKAAVQGDAGAQEKLGALYYFGRGVQEDDGEAANWFRKAAGQGNADAQLMLGYLYRNGQGVPQNYSEAANWFRKAAVQENADAQEELGALYYFGHGVQEDEGEAANWFRKAAGHGNAEAQNWMGSLKCNGKGVSQDHSEAVQWYRKAAEQGNAAAQSNLGVMYHDGKGVPQNYAEAAKWYKKAIEQGNEKAKENLSMLPAEYR